MKKVRENTRLPAVLRVGGRRSALPVCRAEPVVLRQRRADWPRIGAYCRRLTRLGEPVLRH
jgi:hypothetical protein